MKPSLRSEIVIGVLPMAICRRQPKHTVMIHSDQGSQYGSLPWESSIGGDTTGSPLTKTCHPKPRSYSEIRSSSR